MSFQAHSDTTETTGRTRRKVVAYELLSLDGAAETPDRFVTSSSAAAATTSGPTSGPVIDAGWWTSCGS